MNTNKKSTPRELRKFGLTMAIAFGLIAAFLFWRQKAAAPYIGGISGFFLLGALVFPELLAPIEKAWMKLAMVLSAVMTRVILGITFFAVIMPIGLLLRITGKDLLSLKLEADKSTYWRPVEKDGPGTRPDKPY